MPLHRSPDDCPTVRRHARLIFLAGVFLAALVNVRAQAGATNYLFTHLAGPLGGPGSADGTGPDARFKAPYYLTVDRAGNVYVADADNHSIRRITPGGAVSTLTAPDGSVVQFSTPNGVAVDSAGNVVVSDYAKDMIYRISPAGVLSTLAGASYTHYTYYSGHTSYTLGASVDATGPEARFFGPLGLAADSAGNVYVADCNNHTIRKISAAGEVTTLAGTAAQSGGTDDTGPAARFNRPGSVAVDAVGNVYVADTNNHVIRRITPAGVVSTLAGTAGQSGDADGTGAAARFYLPTGVTVDNAGNVYVTDAANDTVRQITPGGVVTTLAGMPGQFGSIDGIGAAARFENPSTLAVDGAGNIYVADPNNYVIRKITPGGSVSTFAGLAGGLGQTDGTGAAARFNQPFGLAVDKTGTVYVADTWNHRIRKVSAGGVVTTLTAVDETGAVTGFREPCGVGVDSAGNVYVANAGTNSIFKITPAGVRTIFAGPSGVSTPVFGSTDGPGATARFAYPQGLAIDRADNVYVADSGNHTIRKITPAGVVSTLAGTAQQTGSADGTGPTAKFNTPIGLAIDAAGTIYVADARNQLIRKITPAGVVTTLAGKSVPGESNSSVDGNGPAARFNHPSAVAVDAAGNVLVGDTENHLIRRISPNGDVTTVGGRSMFIGSADGLGSEAQFFNPDGLAFDSAGTLYIAEQFNHAIRKAVPAGPPVITAQPQSQSVAPDGTVQFSVTASSALPLTYQWYFNDTSFSGATTSTLSFSNARTTDAGDYTVVVTNQLGSAISSKARLTVAAAPVTPPPPAQGGGGGGSMETWFALALLTLAGGQRLAAKQRSGESAG